MKSYIHLIKPWADPKRKGYDSCVRLLMFGLINQSNDTPPFCAPDAAC